MVKYLIRLDDACPYMDEAKWQQMEEILDRYDVKPLVGIIPQNADPETIIESENFQFWEKVCLWVNKGWSIALHGYDHVCVTNNGGINPVHCRSEFAGLDYDVQAKKIRDGYKELKSHGLEPDFFFAPSHTYDENTLKAIIDNTPIRKISDTIAKMPYKMKDGMIVVPCQMGRSRKMYISGYWTACYHPNVMDEKQFERLDAFLNEHKNDFISFNDIPLNNIGPKTVFDRLLSFCYFSLRRLKG